MGHPCASSNPPAWCNRKKRRSKKGKRKTAHQRKFGDAMASLHRNPQAHGYKVVGEKTCLKQGGRKLKKGCIWGRGKFRGKLLKKTSR
jgi:hypothetical protein